MRSAILVLGMHRSGTSALTGVLTLAGATAPRSPLPANFANERGYFESIEFKTLHDDILASAGTNWRDWRPFPPDWRFTPQPAAFRARAVALLRAEFGDAPLIALKDPRICRFAPFWIDVAREAGYCPRIVIPYRAPGEVAQSLSVRDGMPPTEGLLLWLRHVLDAERDTRGMIRAFVPMADLLADWRGALDRIGRQTDLVWPELDPGEIDAFLDVSLKHQNLAMDGAAGQWAAAVFSALHELVEQPQSTAAAGALDAVAGNFEAACKLFGPLAGGESVSAAATEPDLPEIDPAQLQGRAAALRARLEALNAKVAEAGRRRRQSGR